MYKDYRYINAGENEIYRYGKKAIEKVESCLTERNGFFSIPVDGGKYWTFGTSTGKYGEFIKHGEVFFSVNSAGRAYAKAGTEKGDLFVKMLRAMIDKMSRLNAERFLQDDEENED